MYDTLLKLTRPACKTKLEQTLTLSRPYPVLHEKNPASILTLKTEDVFDVTATEALQLLQLLKENEERLIGLAKYEAEERQSAAKMIYEKLTEAPK